MKNYKKKKRKEKLTNVCVCCKRMSIRVDFIGKTITGKFSYKHKKFNCILYIRKRVMLHNNVALQLVIHYVHIFFQHDKIKYTCKT